MLSDIVRALAAREADLEVVGEVGSDADLAAAVRATRADVVLTYAGRPPPGPGEVLAISAAPRTLTLTDDGRVGYLDRLVPHRTVLEDLSSEDLIQALLGVDRSSQADDAHTTSPQPEEPFSCRSP